MIETIARPPQNASPADDPWLTIDEAAAHARLHPQSLRKAIRDGRLRCTRVNSARYIRLRRSWVDAWLLAGEASPETWRAAS
jgi:excisionase family DNA binding protein